MLVQRGLIDVTLVDEFLHNTITFFWEKMKPVYVELRKLQQSHEHPHYDAFEDLYNRIHAKQNPIAINT